MKISEIKITKLFGLNTYTIKEEQIKENKLILVSENGGGKSTILKIIDSSYKTVLVYENM